MVRFSVRVINFFLSDLEHSTFDGQGDKDIFGRKLLCLNFKMMYWKFAIFFAIVAVLQQSKVTIYISLHFIEIELYSLKFI